MGSSSAHTKTEKSFVQVVEAIGEWYVRIVEHGEVTAFQSFEAEEFALSYADGQRLRLGLAEIQRVSRQDQIDPAVWAEQKRRETPPGERDHPDIPPPRDVKDWPSVNPNGSNGEAPAAPAGGAEAA